MFLVVFAVWASNPRRRRRPWRFKIASRQARRGFFRTQDVAAIFEFPRPAHGDYVM